MIRSRAVLAIVLGTAVAACQRAPEPAVAPPSTNAPASEVSAAPADTPGPGAAQGPESSPVPAPSSSRAVAHPRNTAAARTPVSGHRSERVDRVDRVPAPEPIDIPADEAARRAARSAEAEPPMAREPNRDLLVLPAGTELQLVLERSLSSETSRVGEAVTARVERATGPDGRVLLPGGTVLKGRVYRATPAGRVSGKARLAVDFDRIVVRGAEHRLETTAIDVEGRDSHERDAAIVGGSTIGGAIIGGLLGGGSGAKKGAVVGILGGTGAVLATRGREVEIPSGSRWTVRVKGRVAVN
jgi:type IV secretory pathway VirB10-like protein